MDLAKLKAFASLSKYANLKTADLTQPILAEIVSALGFSDAVSTEQFGAVANLLRENNVDGVADLIPNEVVVKKLKGFFSPQVKAAANDDNMFVCPACEEYSQPAIGALEHRCPHCEIKFDLQRLTAA